MGKQARFPHFESQAAESPNRVKHSEASCIFPEILVWVNAASQTLQREPTYVTSCNSGADSLSATCFSKYPFAYSIQSLLLVCLQVALNYPMIKGNWGTSETIPSPQTGGSASGGFYVSRSPQMCPEPLRPSVNKPALLRRAELGADS